MTPSDMLHTLEGWRAAGCLRSLDLALARFIAETDPQAPASLLLAAALLAQLEGRGHCALPIAELLADPQGLLALSLNHLCRRRRNERERCGVSP